MAEAIARFKPGENIPVHAASQILAGRSVTVTGKIANGAYSAAHTAAGGHSTGVAERDSAPTSYPVHSTDRMVNIVRRGAVAWAEAGALINAGDLVAVTTAGKFITYVAPNATNATAIPSTPAIVGRALTGAAGDGSFFELDLY